VGSLAANALSAEISPARLGVCSGTPGLGDPALYVGDSLRAQPRHTAGHEKVDESTTTERAQLRLAYLDAAKADYRIAGRRLRNATSRSAGW
jgi:hypothetical protein